jgi:hypothetical protein
MRMAVPHDAHGRIDGDDDRAPVTAGLHVDERALVADADGVELTRRAPIVGAAVRFESDWLREVGRTQRGAIDGADHLG